MRVKLVTQKMKTRVNENNETTWEIGKQVSAKEGKPVLCTETVVHFYEDELLAIFMNPIHANLKNPRMFEVETCGEIIRDNVKSGCKSLKLIREIEIPKITKEQKIAFAILCSLEVYKEKSYVTWAENWLNRTDRSRESASAAYASASASAAYASASAAAAVAYASAAVNTKIDFVTLAHKAMKY